MVGSSLIKAASLLALAATSALARPTLESQPSALERRQNGPLTPSDFDGRMTCFLNVGMDVTGPNTADISITLLNENKEERGNWAGSMTIGGDPVSLGGLGPPVEWRLIEGTEPFGTTNLDFTYDGFGFSFLTSPITLPLSDANKMEIRQSAFPCRG